MVYCLQLTYTRSCHFLTGSVSCVHPEEAPFTTHSPWHWAVRDASTKEGDLMMSCYSAHQVFQQQLLCLQHLFTLICLTVWGTFTALSAIGRVYWGDSLVFSRIKERGTEKGVFFIYYSRILAMSLLNPFFLMCMSFDFACGGFENRSFAVVLLSWSKQDVIKRTSSYSNV